MRKTLCSVFIATVMAFGGADIARAATFSFDIDFTSGSRAGESFIGTFAIDGAAFTGTGTEVFSQGDPLREVLAFDITIGSDMFSLAGATAPEPVITFQDGMVVGLVADVSATSLNRLDINFDQSVPVNKVGFFPRRAGSRPSVGTIGGFTALVPIPVPGGALLLTTALVGVFGAGVARRAAGRRGLKAPE